MKQLSYILLACALCALTALPAQAQQKATNATDRYTPKAIDLGLPSGTLWADRNMGITSSPTDFGVYYSWGSIYSSDEDDLLPYDQRGFSWRTYRFGKSAKTLTKYCTDTTFGTKDGKTQLEPDDDAATAYAKNHRTPIWDAQWHIPTAKEFEELMEKCNWTWTDGGYKVTGPNGNSIFLPAAGMAKMHLSGMGQYWTSTLCADFPCYAYAVIICDEFATWNNASRSLGLSVRPVKKKK